MTKKHDSREKGLQWKDVLKLSKRFQTGWIDVSDEIAYRFLHEPTDIAVCAYLNSSEWWLYGPEDADGNYVEQGPFGSEDEAKASACTLS